MMEVAAFFFLVSMTILMVVLTTLGVTVINEIRGSEVYKNGGRK